MVDLAEVLNRLSPRHILVLGDLLLDQYTTGRVKRISPEAPVPVLNVEREEFRPGGAGNVALNLVSLGNRVTLAGQVGSDAAGQQLVEALRKEDVDVRGIVTNAEIMTPVKNRLIAGNQQLVRVDHEVVTALSEEAEERIILRVRDLLAGIDVLAISDYAKGFLSPSLLSWVIAECRRLEIPVIVDPKGLDYSRYSGANVVKPNLSEAYLAAGLPEDADLQDASKVLLEQTMADSLMITRSQDGISVFTRDGETTHCPADVRTVKDVTGAGDTVLATVTTAVANGLDLETAARLSNLAASLAIEQLGCARVTMAQIEKRLEQYALN